MADKNKKAGLKILFVNGVLAPDFSAMDIGVTVLATWINRKTIHSASIADLTFHRRNWQAHLHSEIEQTRPDIIGMSCNMMYMQYVRTVLKELRSHHNIPVILGGHHATTHPKELIEYNEVDAVLIGDGEYALGEYLDRLYYKKSMKGVSGLWVKTGDGKVIRNSGGGFMPDIDGLDSLDWDLWKDLDKYFRFLGMLYVQGSRGCPYACTFCDARGFADALKHTGKYFRLRDPRAFARELGIYYEKYNDKGLRLFQIFDPVFTMKTDWLEEFCDEYRELGLHRKIGFSAFSRIDHLDEVKVRLLAASGCALLRVGIESGDDRIRQDVYGKKIDTEKIREIFKIAKAHGMDFTAFYILGGPYETKNDFRKTIRLAWELDAGRSGFFVYKPFSEKGLEQLKQSGGGLIEDRWRKVNNIAFGSATYGENWGPGVVEAYQFAAYAVTFGRRLYRTVRRRGIPGYLSSLTGYMASGLYHGLDWKYLAMYFHIYEGDNVDR